MNVLRAMDIQLSFQKKERKKIHCKQTVLSIIMNEKRRLEWLPCPKIFAFLDYKWPIETVISYIFFYLSSLPVNVIVRNRSYQPTYPYYYVTYQNVSQTEEEKKHNDRNHES